MYEGIFVGRGSLGFVNRLRCHAIQFRTLQQYGATTDTSAGTFGGFGSGMFWNRQMHQVSIHGCSTDGIWMGARLLTASSTVYAHAGMVASTLGRGSGRPLRRQIAHTT